MPFLKEEAELKCQTHYITSLTESFAPLLAWVDSLGYQVQASTPQLSSGQSEFGADGPFAHCTNFKGALFNRQFRV